MVFIFLTIFLWVFVILYWIVSARNADKEHKGSETFSFIKLIGSALVMYVPLLIGGFIATQLFTPTFTSELLGTVLCSVGILIMILARQALGKNWSGDVVIQQKHSLSKTGPYKYVRHPIYSGGLLAVFASAIVIGQIFGFVWALFGAFGLSMKVKQEEDLLTKQFPNKYPLYKKQVKKLIPFIW